MKYLYIGYAVNRQLEKQLTGVSVAGNKMQVNFLKQLFIRLHDKLKCISIYPVAAYPKSKQTVINQHIVNICNATINGEEKTLFSNVPFLLNLPIIKNVFEVLSTYFLAKKLFKHHKFDKIIIFNAFPPTAFAALKLKRKYGCEITCLLADLPIDDSIHTKGVKRILRRWMDNYTTRAIKMMDKLIVLNEEAAKKYAPNVQYLVMEGAVDRTEIAPFQYKPAKRRNVVYTGALQKYNGIVELIEAFELLKECDIELDIYGKGEYSEYVTEACKRNNHIHYYGIVPNSEMERIQRDAYLLINPRPVNDLIALVTFPSKIFEYMTSGTPVLTTRLNGFRPEYFDKLLFIENNSAKEIAAGIDIVLTMTESQMCELSQKAYKFIVDFKNWEVQTERILNFINC